MTYLRFRHILERIMNYYENIFELIGNTPLVKLSEISDSSKATVLGKCEFFNPLGSVKDRIGKSMIDDAILSGKINENTMLVEPTSGNTGIALAYICAAKKIDLTLVMPESMSMERRNILRAFGAKLVLTQKELGMKGAINKTEEILKSSPNSYSLSQFENPANPKAHEETTAKEIINDTDGKVDIFVAGVGTGGTLSGVGRELKKFNPDIKIVAVEPAKSAVMSGDLASPHKIQGIGAGFIPKTLDNSIYDEIFKVEDEDAMSESRRIAKNEGVFVGISSGANIKSAREIAKQNPGKVIVTMLCDTGDRYLSTELFS
jgi:cysteine synthase A